MPETGFPFHPPGPWFNNQEGLPPTGEAPPTPLPVPFIGSVTAVYAITLPPELSVPFVASVTQFYGLTFDPYNIGGSAGGITGTILSPPGVLHAAVRAWGGGGASSSGFNGGFPGSGSGGGGGAFASDVLAVTPSTAYSVVAGAGGPSGSAQNTNGPNGADSSFVGDSSSVIAKGGQGGQRSGGAGGTGGQASASTGATKHSGGTGGTAVGAGQGAGGGGGAGSLGDGGSGQTNQTAGAGGNPDGGAGGAGGAIGGTHDGAPGSVPGGGGGGPNSLNPDWSAGGTGFMIVNWNTTSMPFIPSVTTLYAIQLPLETPFISSVTQVYRMIVNPSTHLTAVAVEVLDTTVLQANTTALATEVLRSEPAADARLTAIAVEVLAPIGAYTIVGTFWGQLVEGALGSVGISFTPELLTPLIPSVTQVYAIQLSLETAFISSATQVYPIQLPLEAPFISSATQIYAITFSPGLLVPFVASVTQVYSIQLPVEAPFIASATQVYSITFSPELPVPFISSVTQLYGLRAWPASFMTGPLGADNILPTGPGAFLGSMFGGIGYSVPQQRTQIAARQSSTGRTYDVIQHHYDGGGTYGGVFGCEDPTDTSGAAPGGITQEAFAIANGSYPAVAWTPNYTIAQINAGTADTILQKMGLYWSQYAPSPIMLRVMWEFDLNGFDWSIYGQGGSFSSPLYSSTDFISAWQRIVTQIQAGGGTNVGFWWVPFEGGGAGGSTGRNIQLDYYPGDAYVDWVGSDLYNTSSGQSSPIHAGYAQWWELFNYSASGSGYTTVWSDYDMFSSGLAVNGQRGMSGTSRVKPFMVGETSTTYDSGSANAKRDFWENVVNASLGIGSMQNCIGVSFFDEDVHSAGDYDWRIDSDASVVNVTGTPDSNTLAGFVAMAQDTKFEGS